MKDGENVILILLFFLCFPKNFIIFASQEKWEVFQPKSNNSWTNDITIKGQPKNKILKQLWRIKEHAFMTSM